MKATRTAPILFSALALLSGGCLVGYEPVAVTRTEDAARGEDPQNGESPTTMDGGTDLDNGPDPGPEPDSGALPADAATPVPGEPVDSDSDGWLDEEEVACGSNPLGPDSRPSDDPANGIADCLESPLSEHVAFFPFAGTAQDHGPNDIVVAASVPPPDLTQDRHGNPMAAYTFSAESCSHFANADHPSPVGVTNELTVAAWVSPSDALPIQKVVGRAYKTEDNAYRGWVLGIGNDRINPEVWDADGTRHQLSSGAVVADAWTHLAMTWKSGGTMRAYVGGVLVGELEASDAAVGDDPATELRIGTRPWLAPDNWCFDGGIDDIRVYDRELTAEQVAILAR